LRLDFCKYAVEVGEVGGIALDRRAIAPDRDDCLIQPGLTLAGNGHTRPFLRETLGNAKANAGAAAGKESDLPASLSVIVTSIRVERCQCSSADSSAIGSSS